MTPHYTPREYLKLRPRQRYWSAAKAHAPSCEIDVQVTNGSAGIDVQGAWYVPVDEWISQRSANPGGQFLNHRRVVPPYIRARGRHVAVGEGNCVGTAYRAQPVEHLDTTPVAADTRQYDVRVAGEQRLERCDLGGDDLDRQRAGRPELWRWRQRTYSSALRAAHEFAPLPALAPSSDGRSSV